MRRSFSLLIVVIIAAAPTPATAQQWQPVFTDIWGTPLSSPINAPWRESFDVNLAAWNTSGDGSDIDMFDYQFQINYPHALSYVPGSFTKAWGWDDWNISVSDDPGSNTLTFTSDSPSVPWPHTLSDDEVRSLGSFQFTADTLNVKDYNTGDRTPWIPQCTDSALFTSDDKSTQLNASNLPLGPDVLTKGQRAVIEPLPPLGPSASRWGVSIGGKAEIENMQNFTDTGLNTDTDMEDLWFDNAQAYRTSTIGQGEQFAYAWSGTAGQDDNFIFSLEAIAQIDDLVVIDTPAEPFTSTARAEIPAGNRLISIGKDDLTTGDSAIVTLAVGSESSLTEKIYPTDSQGTLDWEITVRKYAVDGPIVAVLSPDNLQAVFDIVIGDQLYYEGFLECQALTSQWLYDAGFDLYGASGATAQAKLDIWTHVDIPEPTTLALFSLAALATYRRRRRQ